MKRGVKTVVIILVIAVIAVIIFRIGRPIVSRDSGSDLWGELRSMGVGGSDDDGSDDTSSNDCFPECEECVEVCVKDLGSPDVIGICQDTGMYKCRDGRCLTSITECDCDPTCKICEEKCVYDRSIGTRGDYACDSTGKILCDGIGPCVDDERDCDCNKDPDTRTGCFPCEECYLGACTTPEDGRTRECASGICVLPYSGTCPEECDPQCDLCTEHCLIGGTEYPVDMCIPDSTRRRCSDGSCISLDEEC